MSIPRKFLTVLALSGIPLLRSQPLDLKPADIERLGIVFAPARPAEGASGPRFPATVISSPEAASILTAPHAGVIETWRVAPGATIRAGDELATLRSQDILHLQQEWMAAASAREGARFELDKDERLLAGGLISAQRLNQTRRAHEQAVFAEQAAAEPLRRVGFTDERLQAMRSRGEGLGRYFLLATADGVVTRRMGAAGDFVDANMPLIRLRADGTTWISMQVPARSAAALHAGQILKVSQSGERLVLRQKDFSVEGGSQTIGILAEFSGGTAYLPGQIIPVELPPPPGGILVAGTAVVHSGDETTVFVRTGAGIESRTLPLVPMGSDYLAQSGLAAGEEVVVRGAAVLKGIKAGLGGSE
jgi:multidrug efflux pump subunit AcrA (membrane-fusion protein)